MSYLITFSIILIFSITLTILLKRKIEEVIYLGILEIAIIIFIAGLADNLKIGVALVEILAIFQFVFLIIQIVRKIKQGNLRQLAKNIITPGMVLYMLLWTSSIIINKNRIFEHFDEFSHWGLIVKNMFLYNTYGTNPETIVRFNDYPPFTAIVEYLFIAIKGVYAEDVIIVAQNILYFSIIIPITKHINWSKDLKRLIITVPLIIFIPMIFYKNFYLEILVDGILGVMFAYTIFAAFEEEEELKFKYIKILAGVIMLSMTKASGIALAILAIAIIIIKCFIDRKKEKTKFRKEIKCIAIITIITILLVSAWYIKVNKAKKAWDFTKLTMKDVNQEHQMKVSKNFLKGIFEEEIIAERGLTVFSISLLYLGFNLYVNSKNIKNYKYYSTAIIICIPIYLFALLISYCSIFTVREAEILACFERYVSTILLAYAIFQMFALLR